jgi:hypothetical protein
MRKGQEPKTRNEENGGGQVGCTSGAQKRESPRSEMLFFLMETGGALQAFFIKNSKENKLYNKGKENGKVNLKLQKVLNSFFKSIQVLCLGSMDNKGALRE